MDDPFVTVKRNGTKLPSELMDVLESAVVEQSLTLPDLFVLTFLDEMRLLVGNGGNQFQIGDEVVIDITARSLTGQTLVSGEVTAVEAEDDGTGVYTVVRGYDKGHRLLRGRRVRNFLNQSYSDVVRKLLSDTGIPVGTIDSVATTHPLVSQDNVNDWEFVQGLAREVGYFAGTMDGKFHFSKPAAAKEGPAVSDLRAQDPLQLALGDELLRFRSVVSAVEQIPKVTVRGWDPKTKQAVVGQANNATSVQVDNAVEPRKLAQMFAAPDLVKLDVPHTEQSAAEAAAKGLANEVASASTELDGIARGHPKLRAGAAVSIGLVGAPFDGKYILSTARHIFAPREGYTTGFTVTGLRDNSLWGLANGGLPAGAPPIHGVVIGLVTNNKDPDKLLRVKLKFPWLSDDYETDWVRLVQLGAGAERGSVVVPEVNDEVLVAFDHGDLRRPYVLGGVYNGKDKPHTGPGGEVVASDGSINHRTVTSRTHQTVALIDERGKEGLTLVTGDGKQELALKAGDRKITLTSEGDVEVTAKGSGKMTMDATGDIKVVTKANITIEATGNCKVKANGNLDVEGAMVNVKANGPLVLKGNPIKIN